jgi:hypothetical protein
MGKVGKVRKVRKVGKIEIYFLPTISPILLISPIPTYWCMTTSEEVESSDW